jgi:hypothetical protein
LTMRFQAMNKKKKNLMDSDSGSASEDSDEWKKSTNHCI